MPSPFDGLKKAGTVPKISTTPANGGQTPPPYLQMRQPVKMGPNQTQPVLRPRMTGGMGDRTDIQGTMATLARMRNRV